MARIYIVRHGKAQGNWGEERDPGVDQTGLEQARAAARLLAPLGPLKILSSPYARTLETAAPLAEIWKVTPLMEKRIGEIPTPFEDLGERLEWLKRVVEMKWEDLDQNLKTWRIGVIEAISEFKEDSVLFSHSIAINAIVGEANKDDRVVCFWPENGSITTIDVNESGLRLVRHGMEDTNRGWKNIRV